MPTPDRATPRKLIYVNDDVPVETTDLVCAACESRGLDFIDLHAPSFDFRSEWQLERGDLLFRAGTSVAAHRVEQFLYADGVATFYDPSESIFFPCAASTLVHERAGIPIPRTIHCLNADRDCLRYYADQVGGFPLLIKMTGYSRGIGVIRVDSLETLFSLTDYLHVIGTCPTICAYVHGAVHWRITVVGNRAVSAYRNRLQQDDFRTFASDQAEDYDDPAPEEASTLAVRAVRLLHLEFGGVDILAHPSGRLYVLEVNFPAYFANAQAMSGSDVAGSMVEHLLAKSDRLNRGEP